MQNISVFKQFLFRFYRGFASSFTPAVVSSVPKLITVTNTTSHPKVLFSQLKIAEAVHFNNKHRRRFNYSTNHSAAIILPFTKKELATKRLDHEALLKLSKEQILEHANRRVDLFFYTLIAYYQTNIIPTTGHTSIQHGKGRATPTNKSLTEACHSSLIPSLLDNTIFLNDGIHIKRKSILSGTHFMDSLNSTVELPSLVNQFDDVLENACRNKCLDILAHVSLGKINPIEGLTMFLQMMQDFLNDLKDQAKKINHAVLLKHSFNRQPYLNENLIDLVIQGTLSNTYSNKNQSVLDEYIQLLLRMTPDENLSRDHDELNKGSFYLQAMLNMQNEIFQSKTNHYFNF